MNFIQKIPFHHNISGETIFFMYETIEFRVSKRKRIALLKIMHNVNFLKVEMRELFNNSKSIKPHILFFSELA